MSKLLNPEVEFDKYMDIVGLGHLGKDELQYREMKRSFLSGMMCMFGKVTFELPELEEEEANQELQDMFVALKSSIA